MYSLQPGHIEEEQRKILREVGLIYRQARRAGKDHSEAVVPRLQSIGG